MNIWYAPLDPTGLMLPCCFMPPLRQSTEISVTVGIYGTDSTCTERSQVPIRRASQLQSNEKVSANTNFKEDFKEQKSQLVS